jgi:O-antigen/teichoic acid export membrane protein
MSQMKRMLNDVGTLIRGSVFAQVIGLLLMPVLSRLYEPTDFGAFGLFQAAMLIISVVACLRYDHAILMAENESEAFGLFRLSIFLGFVMSLFVFLAVTVAKQFGVEDLWLGDLSLYWLSPATFFAGMALALTSLFTRLGAFHSASKSRAWQSITNGVMALFAGLVSPAAWGLVLADIVGRLAIVAIGTKQLLPAISLHDFVRESPDLARKYISFPKVSVAGGLLNNAGYFVSRLAIFGLFGAEVNGQFALADRVIALPVGLIVVVFSQVFTSHFSRLLREDPATARSYLRRMVLYAALVGLPPLVIGIAAAPTLFPLIFGAQWAVAGKFAQLLGIMYYMSIVSGPIQSTLVVSGQMSWQFAWEALRLVMLLVFWLIVVWQKWDVYMTLFGFALISAIASFVYVCLAWFFAYVEKDAQEV